MTPTTLEPRYPSAPANSNTVLVIAVVLLQRVLQLRVPSANLFCKAPQASLQATIDKRIAIVRTSAAGLGVLEAIHDLPSGIKSQWIIEAHEQRHNVGSIWYVFLQRTLSIACQIRYRTAKGQFRVQIAKYGSKPPSTNTSFVSSAPTIYTALTALSPSRTPSTSSTATDTQYTDTRWSNH